MNRKKLTVLAIALIAFFAVSCAQGSKNEPSAKERIFTQGVKGPKNYFTGTAWVKMLHTDSKKIYDTTVYNVTFEPCSRTYWHSHPGGQILLVSRGICYYQEKGKPAQKFTKGSVITIKPNVVHWHGASPTLAMTHIGMSTNVNLGPAKWYGPVTDKEYKEATGTK